MLSMNIPKMIDHLSMEPADDKNAGVQLTCTEKLNQTLCEFFFPIDLFPEKVVHFEREKC